MKDIDKSKQGKDTSSPSGQPQVKKELNGGGSEDKSSKQSR